MKYFKTQIFIITLLFYLNSCSKNDEKKENVNEVKDKIVQSILENPKQIIANARIEPEDKILKFSSDISGVITKLNFKAGSEISKGQILFELDSQVEQSQLMDSESNINLKKSELMITNELLITQKNKIDYLKTKYDRLNEAYKLKAETLQNVDNAKNEYDLALNELEKIKAQLKSNQENINNAVTKTELQKTILGKKTIKSPVDGKVLTLDVNEGSSVTAFLPISEIAPKGYICAYSEVDEALAEYVKEGQKAYIRHQGMNDTISTGTVVYASPALRKKSLISDSGSDLEDRRVREVKIRLDHPEKVLFGQRVETVILRD